MAAAGGALGPSTEAYPGGLSLTYGRTDIGLLSTISDGTTTLATYTYVGSREKGVTFGSGATQANTYSGFRQEVTSIHHQDSGTGTLVRMDYGYNAVHDRTCERYGASGSSGDAFEYDKMGRLSKAWMGFSLRVEALCTFGICIIGKNEASSLGGSSGPAAGDSIPVFEK